MASGTPVVTNVSSLPEVVGDAAILRILTIRQPSPTVLRVLIDPDLKREPTAGVWRGQNIGAFRQAGASNLPGSGAVSRRESGNAPRIAPHDWLTGMRGGEKAPRRCASVPDADLFAPSICGAAFPRFRAGASANHLLQWLPGTAALPPVPAAVPAPSAST